MKSKNTFDYAIAAAFMCFVFFISGIVMVLTERILEGLLLFVACSILAKISDMLLDRCI